MPLPIGDFVTNFLRSTLDDYRQRTLARTREIYPNLDEMPLEGKTDCVADVLDNPLARLLRRNIARRDHENAYPVDMTCP